MDKNKTWLIKSKKVVFESRIFKLYNLDCYLPSKDIHHDFYSLHLPSWVNVFSLTEDNKVILVKQHRIGRDQITLEVPAGAIDEGEAPEEAAKRELLEETGYLCDNIIFLKKIAVNPAVQDNVCYFYLALDCKDVKKNDLDPAEEIDVVLKTREEVFDFINNDTVDNSLAYLSLILAQNYLLKNNL